MNLTESKFINKFNKYYFKISSILMEKIRALAKRMSEFVQHLAAIDYGSILDSFSYHIRIWLVMTKNSFQVVLSKKILFLMFLSGKLARFAFFMAFLVFIVRGAGTLAGYGVNEAVFFFLTFNLVDVVAQFLFREVYRFRPLLVSGDLDLILSKPLNTLFRVLLGGADVIDLITIPPLVAAIVFVGRMLNPDLGQVLLYVIMVGNGLLIAAAFHIAVMALGILTFEIDHTIMIYRDLLNLGRFPVDIYREPVRSILTFVVPVGIMVTLPAKIFTGIFNGWIVAASIIIGLVGIYASLRFWKVALKNYTSASS